VGDVVRHLVSGAGTITAVDLKASACMIRFDNLPTERSLRLGIKFEKI
jgi:phage baseplate assembly protein gpV